MEKIPRVLDEARQNVKEADPVYIDTALDENSGDTGVIQQIGTMIPAGSSLRPRYDAASKAALAALDSYAAWLKDDLAHRPHTVTWRTGPSRLRKDLRLRARPGNPRDSGLRAGLRRSPNSSTSAPRCTTEALPLHKQWFPDHADHSDLTGDALQNKIISEVIDRINQDHVEPGQLLEKVSSQAAGIRAFIVQKDLLTLSDRDNMNIVPTPEFLRGVYSVAGFHSAPALDPTAEAEYWVTPIDPKASAKQTESRLREYNNWMLQYLTMHEALPGHYTQFEHANNLQPSSRRILRGLLGNGSYEEGWGEYGVKEMEDAGYANHDPRFVLMVQKIRLRVITNAILDIRMQSRNMTDQEAFDFMQQQGLSDLRRGRRQTTPRQAHRRAAHHLLRGLSSVDRPARPHAVEARQRIQPEALQRRSTRRGTAAYSAPRAVAESKAGRALNARGFFWSCGLIRSMTPGAVNVPSNFALTSG